MKLQDYIKNVPDFPIPGIQFKDITPLIGNGPAFRQAVDAIALFARSQQADVIVGPDARGFIIGSAVAYAMGLGFVPVRKPGKLPQESIKYDYDLEYGKNTLCMHKDGVKPGQKAFIVDDLLATGGTVGATVKLIEAAGGTVVGLGFIIELVDLEGRKKLQGYPVKTLIQY
ncbi:MAG: adenine phosphoribosyltransferase [Candidatus Izemoplasmatales bacterium]|jgi:adenine phosphoribosyltransferase|nr:adenine phosphoribosyltransferase [Candidatus Izemoplasmatales bacterium]MDD3864919.1 adenine phosphoribosyltransferase [Candidatus Izemoplasmatales bacterium]